MTSPVVASEEYMTFPVIEIGSENGNVADQYDIFIQRNFYEVEDDLDSLNSERVQMIPCSSVDHELFQEDGRYYEEFTSN